MEVNKLEENQEQALDENVQDPGEAKVSNKKDAFRRFLQICFIVVICIGIFIIVPKSLKRMEDFNYQELGPRNSVNLSEVLQAIQSHQTEEEGDNQILSDNAQTIYQSNQMGTCADFTRQIVKEKRYIQNLQKSSNEYVCTTLGPIFDDYNFEKAQIYYLAAYQTFLPGCYVQSDHKYSVHRENIILWNQDRAGIEWAISNIKKGDNVVLNRPNKYNLLEIIIMGQLAGASGSLTVVGNISHICFFESIRFYYPLKIRAVNASSIIYSEYSKILTETLDDTPQILKELKKNPSLKVFVYNVQKAGEIESLAGQLVINKYIVHPKICRSKVLDKIDGAGAYSFENLKNKQQQTPKTIAKKQNNNKHLVNTLQKYESYKQEIISKHQKRYQLLLKLHDNCSCLNVPVPMKRIFYNFVISIYGSKLYEVDLSLVQKWEKRREAIEWVRSKAQPNDTVYYEINHDLNLLAITEIAKIVEKGKLIIHCSKDCQYITNQIQLLNISNTKLLKISSFSEAVLSNFTITDNQSLIKQIAHSEVRKKSALLAYFTKQRENSEKVFAELILTHQLQQIKLPLLAQECQGIRYEHYYWGIDNINNFYEITKSNRYIFKYWPGSPSTLRIRRKLNLLQSMRTSKVQIKVLNQKLFFAVEAEGIPINKAFPYLSYIHQSDYARAYLMYAYGGGYADIKHNYFDWNPYFQMMQDDPTIYAIGYREKAPTTVACNNQQSPLNCDLFKRLYPIVLGNALFISRKRSPASGEILQSINNKLDSVLYSLILHPADRNQREQLWKGYPLDWALYGLHSSKISYSYWNKYKFAMPYVLQSDYLGLDGK